MKKTIVLILISALILSTLTLVSCADRGGDTTAAGSTAAEGQTGIPGTDQTTQQGGSVEVPDVTMKYVAADVYADADTAASAGLKTADATNVSRWFAETVEFDEDFNIIMPKAFSKLDGFVLRIAQGQYIMEVDVFKVKSGEDVEAVKAAAEYRCTKQRNNGDFKLYDDDEGTNAKMIETGKVAVFGNYVVYAVTENTEVSMLRAQKYVSEHPDCTALELYRAIVKEEN